MPKSLEEKLEELPEERQEKISERAVELKPALTKKEDIMWSIKGVIEDINHGAIDEADVTTLNRVIQYIEENC